MNICPSCGKSYCPDRSIDRNQCMCGAIGGTLVDDLRDTFDEVFHIHEANNATPDCTPLSDGDYVSHIEKLSTGVFDVHVSKSMSVVAQKSLCKQETFPHGKLPSQSASSNEEEEAGSTLLAESSVECSNTTYSLSISLPLVSAMKGSREKQGMEPKKLKVTWAPDVYDPLPNSVSHVVVKSKSQQRSRNSKKNGKNKQKGKASRGSSGKDKKQFRKISGNSDSSFKTLDARDRLVHDDVNDYDKLVGFDVGSPESYCGSSFLKQSLGNVHMSVAEAL